MPSTASPTVALPSSPTPSPPTSPTSYPTLTPREVFGKFLKLKVDAQCPHVCWMGINPGVTSAEEARALLLGNPDGASIEDSSDTYIKVEWGAAIEVLVKFEATKVKSIVFEGLQILEVFGLTAKDFFQFLGQEPDEIRIGLWIINFHATPIPYQLYFSSRKTVIETDNALWDWNSPKPDDRIISMTLNTDFDDSFLQNRDFPKSYDDVLSDRQPWLGYGHLCDYLSHPSLPPLTFDCMTPTPEVTP